MLELVLEPNRGIYDGLKVDADTAKRTNMSSAPFGVHPGIEFAKQHFAKERTRAGTTRFITRENL